MPEDERARYPGVQWQDIVDLRNRLIHGYDAVDFDILWQIIEIDLPELIEALENKGVGEAEEKTGEDGAPDKEARGPS